MREQRFVYKLCEAFRSFERFTEFTKSKMLPNDTWFLGNQRHADTKRMTQPNHIVYWGNGSRKVAGSIPVSPMLGVVVSPKQDSTPTLTAPDQLAVVMNGWMWGTLVKIVYKFNPFTIHLYIYIYILLAAWQDNNQLIGSTAQTFPNFTAQMF